MSSPSVSIKHNMKTTLRYIVPVLGLAVLPPCLCAAADQPAPAQEKKSLRILSGPDRNVVIRHNDAGEMEPATFLGVETAPVSATLTAQLGLQEGAGLIVNHVAADSPAAAVLKPHDILLKLDDQLLIEQRQLAVLIRSHKEGDEVTLTFLRGGKQGTAKVKLAKRDLPKMSLELDQLLPGLRGPGAGAFAYASGDGLMAGREDVDRLLGLIDRGLLPGLQQMNIVRHGGSGDRSINVTVNTGNSHVMLEDDKGSLDLAIREGKKELLAKNPKGEQVFSGPVNTPEERQALPADVRTRLEQLEDSTHFSFKTDGDFQGAEMKVVRPRGQSIAAPLPPLIGPRPLVF